MTCRKNDRSVFRKTSIVIKKWGLGRSSKRGEGGSPTLSPFPGEGVWGFGKDADIERPKALQGRKANKAFLKG